MGVDDDVLEAVFRHQFSHNYSGLIEKRRAAAYYLSVGPNDEDPTDDLVARFRGLRHTVRKVSQCAPLGPDNSVVDRETGEAGVLLRVTGITWLDDREAAAEGGYYEARRSASGNTYRVRQQDDQWVVVTDVVHWIS